MPSFKTQKCTIKTRFRICQSDPHRWLPIVILASNLPFSQWETIFKDPLTSAAAIDRLVHHSVILEVNLRSYRLESAKKSKTSMPEV